jgi:hypothetical protein
MKQLHYIAEVFLNGKISPKVQGDVLEVMSSKVRADHGDVSIEMSLSGNPDKVPPYHDDCGISKPCKDWKIQSGDLIVDGVGDIRYSLRGDDRDLYQILVSLGFKIEIRSKISQGLCLAHGYRGVFVIKW